MWLISIGSGRDRSRVAIIRFRSTKMKRLGLVLLTLAAYQIVASSQSQSKTTPGDTQAELRRQDQEKSVKGLSQDAADYILASSSTMATSSSSGGMKPEGLPEEEATSSLPDRPSDVTTSGQQQQDNNSEKPAEAELTTLTPLEEKPSEQQQLVRNRKSPESPISPLTLTSTLNSTSISNEATKQPTSAELNQAQAHMSSLDYDDFDLDYQLKLNTTSLSSNGTSNDPPPLIGPGPTLRPPSWSALIRQQPHVFTPSSPMGQQNQVNSSSLLTLNNTVALPSLLTVKSTQLSSQELEQVRPQFLLYPQHDSYDGGLQGGSQGALVGDQPNGDLLATATAASGSMSMGSVVMLNGSLPSLQLTPPTIVSVNKSMVAEGKNASSMIDSNDQQHAQEANQQQSKANQWFNYPHPNLHHNPLLLHHILHKPTLYAQHVGANQQQQQTSKIITGESNSSKQIAWRSTTMATPLLNRQVEPQQPVVAINSSTSERVQNIQRAAGSTQARMLMAPIPIGQIQQTKTAAGQLLASPSLLREIYAPRPTLASTNWPNQTPPIQSNQDKQRQQVAQLMAAKEAMDLLRAQLSLKAQPANEHSRQVSDEDMSTYVSQLAMGFQQQQTPSSSGLSGAEQALIDQQALQLLQQLKMLNSSLNLNELEQVILRLLEATAQSNPNQTQASDQNQQSSAAGRLLHQLKTLNPKQQLQLPQPIVGNWHRRPAVHVDPPPPSLPVNHQQQPQHVLAASSLQPTNVSANDFHLQRQQQLLLLAHQERQKQLAFIEALKTSLAAQSSHQARPSDADLTYVSNRLNPQAELPASERDILALAASAIAPTNSSSDHFISATFDEQLSNRPIPDWLERQIVHDSLNQRGPNYNHNQRAPSFVLAHTHQMVKPASSVPPSALQLRPLLPTGGQTQANSIQALLQQMQLQQQLHQAQRHLAASATTSSGVSSNQDLSSSLAQESPNQNQVKMLTSSDRLPFASAPAYLIKLPTLTGGTITASGSFAPPGVRLLRPRPLVPLRLLSVPTRLRLVAPASVHFHHPAATTLALQSAPSASHHLRLAHQHHLPQLANHLSHHLGHLNLPHHQLVNFRAPHYQQQHQLRHHHQLPSHLRPIMSLPPQTLQPMQLQTLPSQSNEQLALVEPTGQHQPISNTDLASQPARLQLYPAAAGNAPAQNSTTTTNGQFQTTNVADNNNRQQVEQQHESTRAATLSRLQQATASLVELTSLASLVDEMVGGDPSPAMSLMQALNSLQQQQSQQNSNLNTQASATSQLHTAEWQNGGASSDAPPPFSLKTLLGAGLWQRDRPFLTNGAKQRDLDAIERIVSAAKRPPSGQTARLRVKYIRLPVAVYEPAGGSSGQGGNDIGDVQAELVGGNGQTATDKDPATTTKGQSSTNSKTSSGSIAASSSTDYLFDELSSDSSLQPQLALALRDLAAAGSQHEEPRQQDQLLPLTLPWAALSKSNRVNSNNKNPLELYHSMMTAASSQQYDHKDHHHYHHKDGAGRQRKRNKSRQRGKETEQDYGGGGGGEQQDDDEAEDHLSQSDLPILESLISTILHGGPSSASAAAQPPPPPAMAYGLLAPFAAGYPTPYGPHYMLPWSPLSAHGRINPYSGLRAESSSLMESYAHPTSGHHHHHSLNPFTKHRFSLGEVMGALGARKLISNLLSKGKRARTSKRTVVTATPSSVQVGSTSSNTKAHLFNIMPTTPLPPLINNGIRTTSSRHPVATTTTATPLPPPTTTTATAGRSKAQVVWMPPGGGKSPIGNQRHQTSTTTRRPVIKTFVGKKLPATVPNQQQTETNNTTSTTRRPTTDTKEVIVLRSHQYKPRPNEVQFNFHYLANDSSSSNQGKLGAAASHVAGTSSGSPVGQPPKAMRRKEDIMAMPLYHVVADHYSKLYSGPPPILAHLNQRQQHQAAPPRLTSL